MPFAPWAMKMKSSTFESSKQYLLALHLKTSIVQLLTSVRMSWKVPIYDIIVVLMILNHTPLYYEPWLSELYQTSKLLCTKYESFFTYSKLPYSRHTYTLCLLHLCTYVHWSGQWMLIKKLSRSMTWNRSSSTLLPRSCKQILPTSISTPTITT